MIQYRELIKKIIASNGSVFTGDGTNTYLIGKSDITIVDPGPNIDHHVKTIIKEVGDNAKRILVTLLIIVSIISIPIISFEGNKAFKHALEWDYFIGVITFYLLTFLMWKKN